MQKDKLTLKNIKQDLRSELKSTTKRLILFGVLFAVGLVLTIVSLVALKDEAVFIRYVIESGVLSALSLYLVVKEAVKLNNLYKIFHSTDCIVKDKLVGMEIEEHYQGIGFMQEIYHLTFSGYGEYIIPQENYSWSQNFSMTAKGVYNYSDYGDEFYLVLSKPHTGKILFVYNTKMFDL